MSTHHSELTLVTALFDIGRGQLDTSFQRNFEHYKQCFSRLLELRHLSMVIFCETELESFIWQHRDKENTRLVFKSLDDLRKFPFYNDVQTIRNNPAWLGQAAWLAESTQGRLELYNPLVMSKQFFLNDAALYNFFNSNYFFWIDAGLANTVSLEQYMDNNFEARLIRRLNKMQYVSFPYDGQYEVHGFDKKKFNYACGIDTDLMYIARGGIFGGPKHLIHEINDLYYNYLNDTIKQGNMGTEENILTMITYKNANKCNNFKMKGSGVYEFFEDLKNDPVRSIDTKPLALYVLTYNLPKQFEMCASEMKKALGSKFDNYKKYVINNSDDSLVDAEYQKLFQEYGFDEIKSDNKGINGGRQIAAEHFDQSDHDYMIFFEDDMLMCDESYKGSLCKSGFARWFPNLFENAIGVMNQENLDYLKLVFSELYGDQHINWAWYNLPAADKERLFPERNDGVERAKTKIFYTGTYAGVLPFAVGENFYCNWPILFNKKGNKAVFLDVKWEHKYEQTWMSYVYRDLIVPKKIKVGTILGSPIQHNRIYFYEKRRENEHYK